MRKKFQTGDLLRFPLNKQEYGYARVLCEEISFAVYDFFSKEEINYPEQFIDSEILFIARVNVQYTGDDGWKKVINIPLEENLNNFHPIYF